MADQMISAAGMSFFILEVYIHLGNCALIVHSLSEGELDELQLAEYFLKYCLGDTVVFPFNGHCDSYWSSLTRDEALHCFNEGVGWVCRACGKMRPSMNNCANCKFVHYCSRRCQKSDWATHKAVCPAMREVYRDAKKRRNFHHEDTVKGITRFGGLVPTSAYLILPYPLSWLTTLSSYGSLKGRLRFALNQIVPRVEQWRRRCSMLAESQDGPRASLLRFIRSQLDTIHERILDPPQQSSSAPSSSSWDMPPDPQADAQLYDIDGIMLDMDEESTEELEALSARLAAVLEAHARARPD